MRMIPLLSVVLVGRNDDYGGDFRERLERSVATLHMHLLRSAVPSEIIFVNYNPLPAPDIADFVCWPTSTGKVAVNVLTVPGTVHRKLVSDGTRRDVPVLEYVAKNAGIRAAEGRFILCMNPDIILPHEFPSLLDKLHVGCFYRADRIDFIRLENDRPAGYTMLFAKGHHYQLHSDSLVKIRLLRALNSLRCMYKAHTVHFRRFLDAISWTVYSHNAEFRHHCEASGDFLLMHRDHWKALGGYDERARISLHVDALMVIRAATSGLREVILPWPVYHMVHESRYDATVQNPEYRKAYMAFQDRAQQLINGYLPDRCENPSWGLATFGLEKKQL